MNCYRIKNWAEIYESHRTRPAARLKWFPCPIKLSGDGYTMIMELPDGSRRPDGPAIFGAWMACLEVAAECKPRGTLVRSDGFPHNPASLSRKTRQPADLISKMMDFCLKECKWLETIQIQEPAQIAPENAQSTPSSAQTAPYMIGHDITVNNKPPVEQKPVIRKTRLKAKKDVIDLGNGKTVTWAFFQKIIGIVEDREQAARIIYRSKDKPNPAGWIIEGLKKGNMYALIACPSEDTNSKSVREWIDRVINKYKPGKTIDAAAEFRNLSKNIEEHITVGEK